MFVRLGWTSTPCFLSLPAVHQIIGNADVDSRVKIIDVLGPAKKLPDAFWFLRDVLRVGGTLHDFVLTPVSKVFQYLF